MRNNILPWYLIISILLLVTETHQAQTVIREKIVLSNNTALHHILKYSQNQIDSILCWSSPFPRFIFSKHNDPEPVWYGNCEESGDCVSFFRETQQKWNVKILEGQNYVSIKISKIGTCDSFNVVDDSFLFDDQCMYLVFDKAEPQDTAYVKIRFTRDDEIYDHSFTVYRPEFNLFPWFDLTDIHYDEEQYVGVIAVNQCNNSWPDLSDLTTYSAEIIKGNHFGELWNYDTDEHSDSLYSMSHWDGQTGCYFVANDSIPNKKEEVVIKVFTSDLRIEPIFLSFNVMPPLEFIAKATPSKIKPSCSSHFSFSYVDEGVINNFPDYQLFNIYFDDGEEYGSIISDYGCDTAKAFYYTPGTFQFIAADSINGESANARIVVETEMGGGAASKIKSFNPANPTNIQENVFSKEIKNWNSNSLNKASNNLPKTMSTNQVTTLRDTIIINISEKNNDSFKIYSIRAAFDKDTLYAGDIANVGIIRIDENGNASGFPGSTLFEVGLNEGCEAGMIMAGGSKGYFFSGVHQPIQFAVNDSLTSDSTKVILRVGVNSDDSTTYIPYVSSKIKNITDSISAFPKTINKDSLKKVAEACSAQSVIAEATVDADAVVKDKKCKQKIVVCGNLEPQLFKNESLVLLGENQPWQWKDSGGNIKTTNTGTACNYKQPANCNVTEFGKTYLMTSIGDYSPGMPIYKLLDDMDVKVCLDKSIPGKEYWQFSVDNIRVPIFISHCQNMPKNCGWTDLGDGTNNTLLTANIVDCASYKRVMNSIDWWKIGPYSNEAKKIKFPYLYYKYYFSAGTIAHENFHVEQLKVQIPIQLNGPKGVPSIIDMKIAKTKSLNCPEEALDKQTQYIQKLLTDVLIFANNLEDRLNTNVNGQPNSELAADKGASSVYETIKKNIENWAKQQIWWCNNGMNCENNTCP